MLTLRPMGIYSDHLDSIAIRLSTVLILSCIFLHAAVYGFAHRVLSSIKYQ